jgi:hypothetical protein
VIALNTPRPELSGDEIDPIVVIEETDEKQKTRRKE